MKCKCLLLFILVTAVFNLSGEQLVNIGPLDKDALSTLKGFWVIEKSQYTLEFTADFACRVTGLPYYHYKRMHAQSQQLWIYTVVRSKKTSNRYFARGNYRDGRFYGSTSRLEFDDKDHITVYSSKDPKQVYFRAVRREFLKKKFPKGSGSLSKKKGAFTK